MNIPRRIRLTPAPMPTGRWHLAVASVAAALLLSACAAAPVPPTAKLQAAELAIGNADNARIVDQASPELRDAREKLSAARTAVQQEEMVAAARLADESRASAELASARADLIKAQTVNTEMQKNLQTLEQEMQRRQGVSR